MIHMDIGGHPLIPLAQNNSPLWQFPSYFSSVFRVPNFWGRFEALNNVFCRFEGGGGIYNGMHLFPTEICKARTVLSNGLSRTQIGDRMQTFSPLEIDCSTNHLGDTNFMTVHILGLCFRLLGFSPS